MLDDWAEIDQEMTSHDSTREYTKWMAENIRLSEKAASSDAD